MCGAGVESRSYVAESVLDQGGCVGAGLGVQHTHVCNSRGLQCRVYVACGTRAAAASISQQCFSQQCRCGEAAQCARGCLLFVSVMLMAVRSWLSFAARAAAPASGSKCESASARSGCRHCLWQREAPPPSPAPEAPRAAPAAGGDGGGGVAPTPARGRGPQKAAQTVNTAVPAAPIGVAVGMMVAANVSAALIEAHHWAVADYNARQAGGRVRLRFFVGRQGQPMVKRGIAREVPADVISAAAAAVDDAAGPRAQHLRAAAPARCSGSGGGGGFGARSRRGAAQPAVAQGSSGPGSAGGRRCCGTEAAALPCS